ncbi:hypothetical protein D910_11598 [Dendroctonus ponderosae]|uniref:Uncharacterized protein n=1 Tax=Dendroctonus ponderosae TaxID=77166 RepID=U4UMG9_DENPD|nr:hypothetical protein D910_11598 [Dendroctonus ponderosae]
MECKAARGAANMLRILETGGGGVTDTSERSLEASLCCVIATGDAVVKIAGRELAASPLNSPSLFGNTLGNSLTERHTSHHFHEK